MMRLAYAVRTAALVGMGLTLAGALGAAEPVNLHPYPQKVRTFYPLNASAVPPELRSNSVPLPVGNVTSAAQANDGAVWLGTTQGLVRLQFSGPERDRRQYFSGKRYLPDDIVEQLCLMGMREYGPVPVAASHISSSNR